LLLVFYLFAVPRAIFFILRFAEPRGTVRLALGVAFLRAARFAFLRSSLLSDFVFAIEFQSEWDVVEIATTIVMAAHCLLGFAYVVPAALGRFRDRIP